MAPKSGAPHKAEASRADGGDYGQLALSRAGRMWKRAPQSLFRLGWRLFILGVVVLSFDFALAGCNINFNGDERQWSPKRVLVVTAHPDDEAMFFAPAIVKLARQGVSVHGLCLSTGNADGLGDTRRSELFSSYAKLGVPAVDDDVTVVDDASLQDGMQSVWDAQRIAHYIVKQAEARGPYDAILTFDKHGVSQHINHIACYEAAEAIVRTRMLSSSPQTRIYALRSIDVATKFLSVPGAVVRHHVARALHVLRSRLGARHTPGLLQPGRALIVAPLTLTFLSSSGGYRQALHAMLQHRSQLVWFRYLYVVLSSYMYGVQMDLIE